MFIMAFLPNKDRKIYGLFTPYASCLFVQSMHVNQSHTCPFMCSKSYGAVLHLEQTRVVIVNISIQKDV